MTSTRMTAIFSEILRIYFRSLIKTIKTVLINLRIS